MEVSMPVAHIKSIFVPFSTGSSGAQSTAVAFAASLAGRADAHVAIHAMAVKIAAPYSLARRFTPSDMDAINTQHQAELDKAVAAIEMQFGGGSRRHTSVGRLLSHDDILTSVAIEGRLHDLSVVDLPDEQFTAQRLMVEELLFDTGRPVMVIPKSCEIFSARRIMIAWDGSARASRALNDAMPFLRAAETVNLVSAVKETDPARLAPGAEVAPQLARHDVRVEVVDLPHAGNAGEALLQHARKINADMLVMGAFAHSTWRQFVLGGVTTTMLAKTHIPVFMSH
jgi:nucleotide-binding universal stress UspA family protein